MTTMRPTVWPRTNGKSRDGTPGRPPADPVDAAPGGPPPEQMTRPSVGGQRRPSAGRARRPAWRHQPPVYSPLPASALAAGLVAGVRLGTDARPALPHALRANYMADQAVLCASGTQALVLALRAAASLARGESAVALPAYTCYDVAAAAVAVDLPLYLYDIDPETLSPDLDSLDQALTAGAGIAVISPLYGIPVDWSAVESLCARHGAVTIEDAAQGFGARWQGHRLGTFGPLSVLSFGRGKGWTGGRGGALLLRGQGSRSAVVRELPTATAADDASTALVAVAQAVLGRPSFYRLPLALPGLHLGETVYRDTPPPAAMSRVAAKLVQRSLDAAELEAATRTRNAAALLDALPARGPLTPVRAHLDASPGYLRLPLLVRGGVDGLAQPRLAKRLGAAPGYPTPLSHLPEVRQRLAASGRWPGAERLARELITLPTHSLLRAAEREQLLRAVNREMP